jgi:hypothetical protein
MSVSPDDPLHKTMSGRTSCFQQFIVSWYSCWFLRSNMSMMAKSVMARFRSKSCLILRRIMEGEMLSA